MKAIMMTVRLWWFYLTYKGIKTIEIRKRFTKDFKGKIFEYVSKTNWKKDMMKIPVEEREFFKQFVGKVGLCFECDKVEDIECIASDNSFAIERYITKELSLVDIMEKSCLYFEDLKDYLYYSNGYAIHITNLEIFDKPKEISEFKTTNPLRYPANLYRAPQSFCFIEV